MKGQLKLKHDLQDINKLVPEMQTNDSFLALSLTRRLSSCLCVVMAATSWRPFNIQQVSKLPCSYTHWARITLTAGRDI
jgi:hypothetical protein